MRHRRALLRSAAVAACGAVFLLAQPAPVRAAYPVSLVANWGAFGSDPGQFDRPVSVAVAPDGSVYTLELGNNRIQRFTSSGAFLLQWGQQGNGRGQFGSPRGLAVGIDGSVYESDYGISRIQKFDANGTFVLQFGTTASACHRQGMWGGLDGFTYSALAGCPEIDKYIPLGTFVTALDSHGWDPMGITGDAAGHLYFVSSYHVVEISTLGILINSFGILGSGPGQLSGATGIALDPAGNVLVANTLNDRIEVFDGTGVYLGSFGGTGSAPTQMSRPAGVAVAPDGTIYVADTGNNRIDVYAPASVPAAATSWGRLKATYR